MRLIDLSSPLWQEYRGAYGSVRREVEILMAGPETAPQQQKLRRLDPAKKDDYRIAFDNLCEELSHQMSFYEASYLVLPYMVKLLEQKEAAGDFLWQVLLISEMGICLATDVPWNHRREKIPQEILDSYRESVITLGEKAKQLLFQRTEDLRQLDQNRLSLFCTGLLSLLGDRQVAFALAMNYWETCYVQCGGCGYLDEDLVLSDPAQIKKIRPARSRFWQRWDRKSYTDTYRWFGGVLRLLGDQKTEEKLAFYCGSYTCPVCGARGSVLEGLIRVFDGSQPVTEQCGLKAQNASNPRHVEQAEQPVAAATAPRSRQPEPTDLLETDNALTRACELCEGLYPDVFALLDAGDVRGAADLCGARLKETPDWRLYVLQAHCWKRLRKAPETDRSLTAALELDPDNILILRARCPTAATTNRYRRQIGDITRLMELDPANMGVYLVSRAYRLHWTKDDEGARRDLRAARDQRDSGILRTADFQYLWKELLPEETIQ